MIDQAIRQLVDYGLRTGLVGKEDEIYTVNRLLELLEIEEYGLSSYSSISSYAAGNRRI